jgi:predicted ATPase
VARVGRELTTSRLVTLVGPGGVGKTSVARAVGGDAATFVDLAALLPASSVEAVASAALAASAQEEVVGKGPVESIVAAARRAPLLLLLDNAEHVLDATAAVAAALIAGSDAVVLSTSRERLAVDGETVIPVPGLDPDAAATLFRARAGDGDASTESSDDDLVAWVCESVDGLPLAIELAAARTRVLPLRDLARALGHGVDVLEGGDRTRARHRSLAAAIGWSYDLLSPADQRAHRGLAVLPGRFGVADAGAVTGAGEAVAASLARLVEASLLVRDGLDAYRQLDLVRSDAGRRLDAAGERTSCEDRLLAWVAEHPGQERSVLLAAADAAARRTGDPAAAELLGRLAEHWAVEHAWTDAVSAAERGASVSGRADLAVWAAELAWSRWRGDDALRLFTLAGDLALAAGDGSRRIRALVSRVELPVRFGAIVERPPDPAYLRRLMDEAEAVDDDQRVSSEGALLMGRTWATVAGGDHVAAETLGRAAAAAAEAAGDWVVVSAALDAVMDSLALVGDVAAMNEVAERRFLLRDHLGGSVRAEMELSDVLDMATDGPRYVGDFPLAHERAQLVLVRETARGLPYVGLGRLLLAEFFLGRWTECLAHGEEMRQAWLDDGSPRAGYLAPAAMVLAAIGGYRGDADLERTWSRLADELHEGSAGISGRYPLRQALRADVALWAGRREEAAAHVTQEPATILGPSRPLYAATRAEVLGGDAVAEAEPFLGGSAYAAALLHRARGDLEAAERGFVACGAGFQVHRTRLLRDPDDASARDALSALGLPPA